MDEKTHKQITVWNGCKTVEDYVNQIMQRHKNTQIAMAYLLFNGKRLPFTLHNPIDICLTGKS